MKKKLILIILLSISVFPSFVKVFLYKKLFSASIGKNVKIGFGCILIFENLEIGNDCRISGLTLIRVNKINLGLRCSIGMFTRISLHTLTLAPSVTIGSQVSILANYDDPRSELTAGAETWIFDYCYINPSRAIHLGRNVGIGGGSYLFTHGLWLSRLSGYPVSYGEINIGNDVWLPWGCFIMPGVTIGSGAVVGARSLVTKSVPNGSLVAGSPAKVIRETVAVNPSINEKITILEDVTRDYSQLHAMTFTVEHIDDWVIFVINGIAIVVIASTIHAGGLPNHLIGTLVIVHERLCETQQYATPMFSLSSYQCTPRGSFTVLQASWLEHLRSIGTRHYPLDEVQVESDLV